MSREGPQHELEHEQLREAYVLIESLLTWPASQEEFNRAGSHVVEKEAMILRMVMA